MDDALMNDTPPVPTWENLKKPRLRRCPFDLEDITWLEKLGYGIDGFVWKVKFKDETLYALKLVSHWQSQPSTRGRHELTILSVLGFRKTKILLLVIQHRMPSGDSAADVAGRHC